MIRQALIMILVTGSICAAPKNSHECTKTKINERAKEEVDVAALVKKHFEPGGIGELFKSKFEELCNSTHSKIELHKRALILLEKETMPLGCVFRLTCGLRDLSDLHVAWLERHFECKQDTMHQLTAQEISLFLMHSLVVCRLHSYLAELSVTTAYPEIARAATQTRCSRLLFRPSMATELADAQVAIRFLTDEGRFEFIRKHQSAKN